MNILEWLLLFIILSALFFYFRKNILKIMEGGVAGIEDEYDYDHINDIKLVKPTKIQKEIFDTYTGRGKKTKSIEELKEDYKKETNKEKKEVMKSIIVSLYGKEEIKKIESKENV